MSQQTTLEESYLNLLRFLLRSKQRVIELAARRGLTAMQTITLLLLETPRPMGDFTKTFHCDPSNVTGIIDGLEEKGLVSRFDVEDDRRIKMVKLLPRGRRTRTALLRSLAASDNYLLAGLSPREIATFNRLLRKITATEIR